MDLRRSTTTINSQNKGTSCSAYPCSLGKFFVHDQIDGDVQLRTLIVSTEEVVVSALETLLWRPRTVKTWCSMLWSRLIHYTFCTRSTRSSVG